jgi:predicted translin family RNA/ssDNA-binding protein
MIDVKFLETLKTNYRANESERRQIISASNNILFEAKKTIFALQRDDFKAATTKLSDMEAALKNLASRFGTERLQREGAYKAAVEEYLEGKTFFLVIKNKKIAAVEDLKLDYEGYLGGVCDMIGELVRYATNRAAAGKFGEVAKIKKVSEDIMSQLIDFDMTGYLRTKYDQARGHLRKLEQMAYEIKLRGKK